MSLYVLQNERWVSAQAPPLAAGGRTSRFVNGGWWKLDEATHVLSYSNSGADQTLPNVADFWIGRGAPRALLGDGTLMRLEAGQWRREQLPSWRVSGTIHLWMNSDGSRGFIYGAGGVLLRLSAGRWSSTPTATVIGSDDLYGLWFTPDGSDGWVAGNAGALFRYSPADSGTWVRDSVTGGATADWRALALDSKGKTGWMVGRSGALARREAGVWRRSSSPTTKHLNALWLDARAREGYVVGDSATVLRLAGGQWRDLGPIPALNGAHLTAVYVSTKHERIWIKHTGPGGVSTFLLTDDGVDFTQPEGEPIEASALTIREQDAWMVGIRPQDHSAKDYSVLRSSGGEWLYQGKSPSTPKLMWIAPDSMRGILVGPWDAGVPTSPTLAVFLEGVHTYRQELPIAGQVHALWVNDDGTQGWVAGDHGLIAKMVPKAYSPPVLDTQSGSIHEVRGAHRLKFRNDVALPVVEDIAVLQEGDQVRRLRPGQHFTVDTPAAHELRVEFKPAVQTSLRSLEHEEITLRWDMSYPRPEESYKIAYSTGAFLYKGRGTAGWALLVGGWVGIGFILFSIVVPLLAIWFRSIRLFAFRGEIVVWIFTVVGRAAILPISLKYVPWVRRQLFRDYRAELPRQYKGVRRWNQEKTYIPPNLRLPATVPQLHAGEKADNEVLAPAEPAWKLVYRQIRQRKEFGEYWILTGVSGLGKTSFLENLAAYAISLGDTPFLIRLGEPGSVSEKCQTAMSQWGHFPDDAPPLYKYGGFVFLLDGLNEDADTAQTLDFMRKHRAGNRFIVTSQTNPGAPDIGFIPIELKPFDVHQLSLFIPPKAAEQVASNSSLRETVTLPVVADLLKSFYERTGRIPNLNIEIYLELRESLGGEAFPKALDETAWRLFHNNELQFGSSDHLPQPWLEGAVDKNVLARSSAPSDGTRYQFTHERLRDFFVANFLFRQSRLLEEWLETPERPTVPIEWLAILEFWAELILWHGLGANGRREASDPDYEAFLMSVGRFNADVFDSLDLRARQLVEAGIVRLSNEYFKFIGEEIHAKTATGE